MKMILGGGEGRWRLYLEEEREDEDDIRRRRGMMKMILGEGRNDYGLWQAR